MGYKSKPFKMSMKSYGQGKSPLEMNSPAKGLFGKILGGAKNAIAGKGALGAVVNPVGAIASGGKGLFMKDKFNKAVGKGKAAAGAGTKSTKPKKGKTPVSPPDPDETNWTGY